MLRLPRWPRPSMRLQGEHVISSTYIWQLRTGKRDNPTQKHLSALAAFFRVSPMYFFQQTEADRDAVPPELIAALRNNEVRDMALADHWLVGPGATGHQGHDRKRQGGRRPGHERSWELTRCLVESCPWRSVTRTSGVAGVVLDWPSTCRSMLRCRVPSVTAGCSCLPLSTGASPCLTTQPSPTPLNCSNLSYCRSARSDTGLGWAARALCVGADPEDSFPSAQRAALARAAARRLSARSSMPPRRVSACPASIDQSAQSMKSVPDGPDLVLQQADRAMRHCSGHVVLLKLQPLSSDHGETALETGVSPQAAGALADQSPPS